MMVDCPCGSGQNIPTGQQTCPACGTDLAPLRRLRALGEQILEERERLAKEKQNREKQISLLKKGLVVLPAVTLLIGVYIGPIFRGPLKTEQLVLQVQDRVQPPPASPPPPADTNSEEKAGFLYTIKKGDTLSKIAFVFYGDSNLWKRIYEANGDKLKDPHIISEGMEIIIPLTGE